MQFTWAIGRHDVASGSVIKIGRRKFVRIVNSDANPER